MDRFTLADYIYHLFCVIVGVYELICHAECTTATAAAGTTTSASNLSTTLLPQANEPHHDFHVLRETKSFPVWLIGVIILSCLGLIILVATVVQRVLRRQARRHEQYRFTS